MAQLLARCATCDRHLRTSSSSCPFCARGPVEQLKSATLAAALLALGSTSVAHADDAVRDALIMPAEDAIPAQVEPHYGIPPEEEPPPPPDDDDDDD